MNSTESPVNTGEQDLKMGWFNDETDLKPQEQENRENLYKFLKTVGLEQFFDTFVENEVKYDDLCNLTNGDLKEMGVNVGPKRRILDKLDEMYPVERKRKREEEEDKKFRKKRWKEEKK